MVVLIAIASGGLPTKDVKVIIEYLQHTNVEKLDCFGGGDVVVCGRLGYPKIRTLARRERESE